MRLRPAYARSLVLAVVSLLPSIPALAVGPPDGVTLLVASSPVPGQVFLSWDSGPYDFSIYRSTDARTILDPGNQIGSTTAHNWPDTPPSARIVYYEVISSCPWSPVDVCDGADNDCDGVTDPPGSEASCSLPHATPACLGGSCVVSGCVGSYGDCDGLPANGCEAPTNIAQSTSPAIYGEGTDADLRPGYARVSGIANCGGCGITCDDGLGCTTDLCVPAGAVGGAVCRHYDRAQCGGARCGGGVQPGGIPPPEPECAGVDADGDGLSNAWESPQADPYTSTLNPAAGIDLDCNGVIADGDGDLIWHEPPSGDSTKDIYLEYDYMAPSAAETESHAPSPEAVDWVVAAFSGAAISLHVDPVHQALPHAPVLYMPVAGPDICALPGHKAFDDPFDYKGNPGVFEPKRRLGYHYFIFAHNSCSGTTAPATDGSGVAEIGGQDGIVSLGDFTYAGTSVEIAEHKRSEMAGTFIHELGHNLDLHHGGPGTAGCPPACADADTNRKPNYVSAMNYHYQFGIPQAATPGTTWPLEPVPPRPDFSHGGRSTLAEGTLDEPDGGGPPPPGEDRRILRYHCAARPPIRVGPGVGPIDWNCDSLLTNPVSEDLNASGSATDLLGDRDDWGNLDFKFQCQPTFADGAPPPERVAREELTLSEATALRLRAGDLLCDAGHEDCDGIASNGCETPILGHGSCPPSP